MLCQSSLLYICILLMSTSVSRNGCLNPAYEYNFSITFIIKEEKQNWFLQLWPKSTESAVCQILKFHSQLIFAKSVFSPSAFFFSKGPAAHSAFSVFCSAETSQLLKSASLKLKSAIEMATHLQFKVKGRLYHL